MIAIAHTRKTTRPTGQRANHSGAAQHCLSIYVDGIRKRVYYTDEQTTQQLADRIAALYAPPTLPVAPRGYASQSIDVLPSHDDAIVYYA